MWQSLLRWGMGVALFALGLTSCQSDPLDQLKTSKAQAEQLYSLGGVEALGNPTGRVTLVMISSYECHYCRKDYPVIKQFVSQHADVRLIYKSYLAFGLDTLVEPQYAALAAAKQHRYAAMNEALFTTNQPLTTATIMSFVKQEHLNQRRFVDDMHSPAIAQQIVNNTDLIDQLGIQGIPTVIMSASAAEKDHSLPQYIQVGFITADVLEQMYQAASRP